MLPTSSRTTKCSAQNTLQPGLNLDSLSFARSERRQASTKPKHDRPRAAFWGGVFTEAPATNRDRLRFGLFELKLQSSELCKRGVQVRLQDQPTQILVRLLERPGHIVSRDEPRQLLWQRDVVDFDEGLNTAVKKLRGALGDSSENPTFIETIPRRGYRFIAPVTREEFATAPSANLSGTGFSSSKAEFAHGYTTHQQSSSYWLP